MNHPRIGRVLLVAATSAVAGLSVAPAANAAPHTGCYRPTADRVLRIIPKADSCLKGERRISWNNTRDGAGQRGPRGLQGVRGEAGAPGKDGAPGAQGAQGAQGAKGDAGAAGANGADGAQGAAGPAGAAGTQGPVGPQGPAGPQGPDGVQGPAGAPGQNGQPGQDGQNGATGAKGDPGDGTIFSSSTAPGAPAVATTVLGGLLNSVSLLPPNGVGSVGGVTPQGGQIMPQPLDADYSQVIARDGTITAVAAQIKTTVALALIGSTLQPTVTIWKSTDEGDSYTQVAGTSVSLAPALTGVLAIGTKSSGRITGLAIPVQAGDRLVVAYGMTVVAGIDVATTVTANVTASFAVS